MEIDPGKLPNFRALYFRDGAEPYRCFVPTICSFYELKFINMPQFRHRLNSLRLMPVRFLLTFRPRPIIFRNLFGPRISWSFQSKYKLNCFLVIVSRYGRCSLLYFFFLLLMIRVAQFKRTLSGVVGNFYKFVAKGMSIIDF